MAQTVILRNQTLAISVLALMILCIPSPSHGDTRVRFDTAMGSFQVQLFDSLTPLTVQNFMNYVNDGDYTNSFFHRLMPGFVLQGGGFTYDPGTDQFYYVPADPPVQNEFNVSNTRGTIAMAKIPAQYDDDENLIPGTGPDSATSEFFFNLVDNSASLDGQNGGFTVFGQVVGDGMDVVDLLATQPILDSTVAPYYLPWTHLPLIDGSYLEMVYSISLVGDVNGDGYVGGLDLTTIITNWGTTGASRAQGDLSGDGTVSGPDYTEVITYWGTGTPPPPEPPASTPEPATLALLLLGALAIIRPRHRS